MFGYLYSLARILTGKQPNAIQHAQNIILSGKISPLEAMKCHAVDTGISITAQSIGEVDFYAPDSDAITAVLRKPNAWQSSSDFWEACIRDMLYYGGAPLRVLPNTKKPYEIAGYNPQDIKIMVDSMRRPSYRATGDDKPINYDQMIFLKDRGINAMGCIRRIDNLAVIIGGLMAADAYMSDTFANGINVSHVLKFQDYLGKDAYDRLDESMQKFANIKGNKRGSYVILEKGGDLQALKGLSPVDADLLNLREKMKLEIAAGFNVPPFLVGASGDQKYNNISAQITSMYRQTFSPIIEKIKRTMSHAFGVEVKARDDMLQKGDYNSQVANAVSLVTAGILTPNEARQEFFGYGEVEGGDKLAPASNPQDNAQDRRGEMPSDTGNSDGPDEE